MRALPSDRHRAFVNEMCEQPVVNYAAAARAADPEGWGVSTAYAKLVGHRLAHDERIQEAIREEGSRRLGATVSIAVGVLRMYIENPALPAKDRMKAIGMVLNRAGLPEVSKHEVKTSHEKSDADKVREVIEIAHLLGLDPKTLLGKAGVSMDGTPLIEQHAALVDNSTAVEDAEFEDVTEETW